MPGADESQPETDEIEIQVSPNISTMPDSKSSMLAGKSSMLDAQSSMVPGDILTMLEAIGGKSDDAAMRAVIVRLCHWRALSARELGEVLGRTPGYLKTRYLRAMVEEGSLVLTIPGKPRSPHQKYTVPDKA